MLPQFPQKFCDPYHRKRGPRNDRGPPIPLSIFITPHVELQDELVACFYDSHPIRCIHWGARVEGFEREFAEFCDAKHCVGVTAAARTPAFSPLRRGGPAGDIVITVPHTFIATTEAISQSGAFRISWMWMLKTYTLDPALLRQYMETSAHLDTGTGRYVHRTRANPSPRSSLFISMGRLRLWIPSLRWPKQFGLVVSKTPCQAPRRRIFLEKRESLGKAGSMDARPHSAFYPGKNLGACGEARHYNQ